MQAKRVLPPGTTGGAPGLSQYSRHAHFQMRGAYSALMRRTMPGPRSILGREHATHFFTTPCHRDYRYRRHGMISDAEYRCHFPIDRCRP